MKKIKRIVNIALIFTVIGTLLCSSTSYASNLRVPVGKSLDKVLELQEYLYIENLVLFLRKNNIDFDIVSLTEQDKTTLKEARKEGDRDAILDTLAKYEDVRSGRRIDPLTVPRNILFKVTHKDKEEFVLVSVPMRQKINISKLGKLIKEHLGIKGKIKCKQVDREETEKVLGTKIGFIHPLSVVNVDKAPITVIIDTTVGEPEGVNVWFPLTEEKEILIKTEELIKAIDATKIHQAYFTSIISIDSNVDDIFNAGISPDGSTRVGSPATLLSYMFENSIYENNPKMPREMARKRGGKDSETTVYGKVSILEEVGLVAGGKRNPRYLTDLALEIGLGEILRLNPELNKPSPSEKDIAQIKKRTSITLPLASGQGTEGELQKLFDIEDKILPIEGMVYGVPFHVAENHRAICDWIEGNDNIPERPNLLVLDSHIDAHGPGSTDADWIKTRRGLFDKVYVYWSPLAIEDYAERLGANLSIPEVKMRFLSFIRESMEKRYQDLGIMIIMDPMECTQIQGPTIVSTDMDFYECSFGGIKNPEIKRTLNEERTSDILNSLYASLLSDKIDIVGLDFTLTAPLYLHVERAFKYYNLTRDKLLSLLKRRYVRLQALRAYHETLRRRDAIEIALKHLRVIDLPPSAWNRPKQKVDEEEDLEDIIGADPPIVEACKILFRKGITTVSSSANRGDLRHPGYAYIEIDPNTLSDENLKKAKDLVSNGNLAKNSTREPGTWTLMFPFNEETSCQELHDQVCAIVSRFEDNPAGFRPRQKLYSERIERVQDYYGAYRPGNFDFAVKIALEYLNVRDISYEVRPEIIDEKNMEKGDPALVRACKELYRKGIRVISSSANMEDINTDDISASFAYIEIDPKSVSEENFKTVEDLIRKKQLEKQGVKADDAWTLRFPIDYETSCWELDEEARAIAERFEDQSVYRPILEENKALRSGS